MAVSAGVKIHQANKSARAAQAQADKAAAEQKAQQKLLDVEKAKFKAMKFDNPYSNMENVYEDLTVNQQQAQFQAQQGSQQRANIMQNLRGAAGGSGIAGLAQAMANQGQLQTQQISASIGQQEAANQRAMAGGAANIQLLERQGIEKQQQFEIDRQATMLGMQQGASAGADTAAGAANQMALQGEMAKNQAIAEGVSSVAGAGVQAGYGAYSARQSTPGDMSEEQTIYDEQGNPMSPADN
jgi:hypothetical protein